MYPTKPSIHREMIGKLNRESVGFRPGSKDDSLYRYLKKLKDVGISKEEAFENDYSNELDRAIYRHNGSFVQETDKKGNERYFLLGWWEKRDYSEPAKEWRRKKREQESGQESGQQAGTGTMHSASRSSDTPNYYYTSPYTTTENQAGTPMPIISSQTPANYYHTSPYTTTENQAGTPMPIISSQTPANYYTSPYTNTVDQASVHEGSQHYPEVQDDNPQVLDESSGRQGQERRHHHGSRKRARYSGPSR